MPTPPPTNETAGLTQVLIALCRRQRWLGPALVIVLAGGWVFSPAIRGDWLWDDHVEVLDARDVRDPGGLARIWLAPSGPDYFPLKTTVQWLQWRWWGDHSTLGYHLTSVGLHLLSALLVWRVLRKLGLRLAWLGGLLFAVHPVVVESVAWIAELKNTLSLPLLLLALCAWLDFDERHQPRAYLRALLLFLAAMLCKSSVVMFPVVLLLHAWWKRGRIGWRDLRAAAAFFAVSLVLGLVTVWFQHQRSIGAGALPVGGLASRLAGAGLAAAFYLAKCVLPVGLLPVYPRWAVDPPSALQFLPWAGLAALIGWLWSRRSGWGRHALFGFGFFLLNLLPVLGLIKMSYQYISWVADHFVYLPLIGVIGLAAAGVESALDALPAPRRVLARGAIAALCTALAIAGHRYAGVFGSEEVLWTYTVTHNPDALVARNNLAKVLVESGRIEEGIRQYEAALRIDPRNADAQGNLGNVLVQTGRLNEGIAYEEEALRLKPNDVGICGNLGGALLQAGRREEAITRYQEAAHLDPRNPRVHTNLGNALAQTGRWPEAIQEYGEAVRLQADSAEAHAGLADALARSGRTAEAIPHYETALRLRPGDADAHYNLAYTLSLANRPAEAIGHYEAALRLKPGFAEAHNNLGLALLQLGRLPEAIGHLEQAVQAKPDYADARANLGNALLRAGRPAEAISQYEQAVRLRPESADLHFDLAGALAQAGRLQEAVGHYEETLRLNPNDAGARRALERARQEAARAGD
ncbi:MAG TPA: tetratricopeptide repeat protein [Opitutaceae bacterium]|nr:tetratricopeptide repeat protein [Opitutaceae bacterium]